MSIRRRVWIAGLSVLWIVASLQAQSSLDLGGGVRLDLVNLKAGDFTMGSPAAEAGRRVDEDTLRVSIAEDFEIGKYPVTRKQFDRFINQARYRTEAEIGSSGAMGFDGKTLVQRKEFNWRAPGFQQTDDHPVVCVTYADAVAFCNWATTFTGRRVTLPDERQWEYACRAGTSTRYYSGDAESDLDSIGWSKSNAGNGTRPVGQKKPNAFGLFDMSGNVYEWCSTLYGPYLPGRKVVGELDKPRNVLRGGSWFKSPADARSAARYRNTPGSRNADNGFRVIVGKPVAAKPPVIAHAAPSFPTPATPPVMPAMPGMPAPGVTPSMPTPMPGQLPRGPLDHVAAAHAEPSPFGIGTLLCILMPVVVLIGLIIVVVRTIAGRSKQYDVGMPPRTTNDPSRGSMASGSVRSAGTGRPPPLQSPFRADRDGFWIDTARYNAGDQVDVEYDTPSGRQRRQVTIEPGDRGQFVYTGESPSNLLLQGMMINDLLQQQQRENDERSRATSSSSFYNDTLPSSSSHSSGHGFPSAY